MFFKILKIIHDRPRLGFGEGANKKAAPVSPISSGIISLRKLEKRKSNQFCDECGLRNSNR